MKGEEQKGKVRRTEGTIMEEGGNKKRGGRKQGEKVCGLSGV